MKRVINVDLDNLDEAIKALDEFLDSSKEQAQQAMQKAVQEAYDVATAGFASAIYPGVNDVDVTMDKISDKEIVINATGESVTFIEFGTGIVDNAEHPQAGEFGMIRGAFGDGNGANLKGWVYEGSPGNGDAYKVREGFYRTRGNPANRAMYNAGNAAEYIIDEFDRAYTRIN